MSNFEKWINMVEKLTPEQKDFMYMMFKEMDNDLIESIKEETMIKVIYVAGPYTAPSPEAKLENLEKANYLAKQLTLKGFCCIIPHKITGFWDYEKPFNNWKEEDWLEKCCFPLLLRCDGIVLTEGWEKSSGCLKDLEFAKSNNIPLIDRNDVLCIE